jgi:hypothetical protein
MISLTTIEAMTPKPASLAMRAIQWAISFAAIGNFSKVLPKGRDGP